MTCCDYLKTISGESIWLFRKTFKFTGGEIVNEFLISTGYLPGTHNPYCPVYEKTKLLKETDEKKREGNH